MTLVLTLSFAVWSADPSVALTWRGGEARLAVTPPPGEHVAPEAPARLVLDAGGEGLILEVSGVRLGGLVLRPPGEGDRDLSGSLSLGLCADVGATCRTAVVGLRGRVQGRRGRVELAEVPVAALPADPGALLAAAAGRPALLDFATRWCPPCNLLSAEILDDPAHAEALADLVLVRVDADLPASWGRLKDRYHVGGYPTLVAVDGSGAELRRLEGYPGESATLAWLGGLAAERPLDERLAAIEALDPAARGSLAHDLALAGREEEARRALVGAEGADARAAALRLDGRADDARWLAEQSPDEVGVWGWDALEVAKADPALAELLVTAAARTAARAEPLAAADALDLASNLSSPPESRALAAAGAALVRATLTGDPQADRGRWTTLAGLLEEAGDVDGAIAVLGLGVAAYPQEFTYHHALAGLYEGRSDWTRAEAAARAALAGAEGDLRLRAAMALARALRGQGRLDEARAALDQEITAFHRPDPALDVRSHRYLRQAEELRDGMR